MSKRANFRTDSELGNLPVQRQEEIAAYYEAVKNGKRHVVTSQWLAQDGISASPSAVYSWFQRWELLTEFQDSDDLASFAQELEKEKNPDITAEELDDLAARIFIRASLAKKDQQAYQDIQYLKLAKDTAKTKADFERQKIEIRKEANAQAGQRFELEREKFEFDAAKAVLANLAELRSISGNRALNEDEKIEQVRLRLWGAPPEGMEGKP